MRGKKIDNDFLSNFIVECASKNKSSAEDIVLEAKKQISLIENQIKEVEKLKLKRSKLLDVIIVFDENKKKPKEDDAESLQYFKIENQHICKFICDFIKSNSLRIDSIKSTAYSQEDILFCIKQLIEHKIVYKTNDVLVRGTKYDEYYKTIVGN